MVEQKLQDKVTTWQSADSPPTDKIPDAKKTFILKKHNSINDADVDKLKHYLNISKEVKRLEKKTTTKFILEKLTDDIDITDAKSIKITPIMYKSHSELPNWIEKIG